MSDDLVTRLRKKLIIEPLGDKATYLTLGDCLEAADEIERLRKDRYRWLNIAFCTHCLPQHDHYCVEHSQDEDGNR